MLMMGSGQGSSKVKTAAFGSVSSLRQAVFIRPRPHVRTSTGWRFPRPWRGAGLLRRAAAAARCGWAVSLDGYRDNSVTNEHVEARSAGRQSRRQQRPAVTEPVTGVPVADDVAGKR